MIWEVSVHKSIVAKEEGKEWEMCEKTQITLFMLVTDL